MVNGLTRRLLADIGIKLRSKAIRNLEQQVGVSVLRIETNIQLWTDQPLNLEIEILQASKLVK